MKPIILLVDDNPEILDLFSADIGGKYSLLTAFSGEKSLNVAEIKNMINDARVPSVDGYELCEMIRSNFEYSQIPIVLLAAKSGEQNYTGTPKAYEGAHPEKSFPDKNLQVDISGIIGGFFDKLNYLIDSNIQNPDLDVGRIANMMNMSKPTLYRKAKVISDHTINEMINITRLKTAARLLEEGEHKVYQVASLVGYSSQSHLARNFMKQFGTSPTRYQQMKTKSK